MPFHCFDRVTCDKCGEIADVSREEEITVWPDDVSSIGWHATIKKDVIDAPYYIYYCHPCWLVYMIDKLSTKVAGLLEELKALKGD